MHACSEIMQLGGDQEETGLTGLLSLHVIHLGSNVAKYSGEGLHKRIVADKAFAKGDFLAAIKNGFLEMDRALRYGMLCVVDCYQALVIETWCCLWLVQQRTVILS